MKIGFLGLLLMLIAIWGSAFALHIAGKNHWSEVPIVCTGILCFLFGTILMSLGLENNK